MHLSYSYKFSDGNCDVNNCDLDYCSDRSCLRCEEGYYLSGTSYCNECPAYCVKCTDYYSCTECVYGRYGTKCESTCRSTCSDCVGSSECTECIPGRYGSYCQNYCPLGCIDILCEKTTGKCTQGCIHGYYLSGENCSQCPEHCTRCFNSSRCLGCQTGFFGTFCQSKCPSYCKDKYCDKETGYCTEGCTGGYYLNGSTCLGCPQTCLSCVNLTLCTKCKTGYWGSRCQNDCPETCNRCTKGGQCLSGKSSM